MNYSEERNEKLLGIIGTILFHALIVLLLVLVYLRAPKAEEYGEWLGGVPVMFGNVAEASGDSEPLGRMGNDPAGTFDVNELTSTPVDPTTVFQPSTTPNQAIATQDIEETLSITTTPNSEAKREQEAEKIAENARIEQARIAEANRIADQQRAAQKAAEAERIRNLVSGGFGDGSGTTGSRGEGTTGTGTQGVPTGNASHGKMSGVGGWGSYNLGGRGTKTGSGGLVRPTYSANDYGTVVIKIVVNPQGVVLEATIGQGTNTTSDALKQEAIRAARRTKFEEVAKVGNQTGTITYKFNLN